MSLVNRPALRARYQRAVRHAGVAVALLFLVACSDPVPAQPAATITATPSFTPSSVPSPSPTTSLTPSPTPTFTSTPAPILTATPTPTPTPKPQTTFRVLSFNVLYGAGVERRWDSALSSTLAGASRLPALLKYVQSANPDIWGVQEANGWDTETPPIIQQVGQELGMHYVLDKTPGGFHLALLTKFEIVDFADLSPDVGRQGVLRATLRAPDGGLLYVFVVHLDPNSADARLCEVNSLVRQMQPYAAQRTILLGDMNFPPVTRERARLEQAGWQPVAVERAWGIDQIWISPAVDWSATPWFANLQVPSGISDHFPIGAEINVFNLSKRVPTPIALTATATPTATVSAIVQDSLAGATVQTSGFDDACSMTRWTSRWTSEKVAGGKLEIVGESPWKASVSRYRFFVPGQGIALRFQFERDSEFEVSFDNGAWNTDRYRRFGFNLRADAAQAIAWQGVDGIRGVNLSGNLYPKPDTAYDLLVALDKQGEYIVRMQDPANPSQRLEHREHLSDPAPELAWTLGIGADKGKVSISSYSDIVFDCIK